MALSFGSQYYEDIMVYLQSDILSIIKNEVSTLCKHKRKVRNVGICIFYSIFELSEGPIIKGRIGTEEVVLIIDWIMTLCSICVIDQKLEDDHFSNFSTDNRVRDLVTWNSSGQ